MQDVATIFARYEAVRGRAPAAPAGATGVPLNSLAPLAQHYDAFVFDAFGVLNVGDTPIPGAAERLDALRNAGRAVRVLTNAASYDRMAVLAKLRRLGIDLPAEHIVSSRAAALASLDWRLWGVIAAEGDSFDDIAVPLRALEDDPAAYDAVEGVLFLSSSEWNETRQRLLEKSLRRRPREVRIANPDLVAPRGGGFSIEPGFYGHRLVDLGLGQVRFYGKPFAEVYEMVEATLPGTPAARILMCGDTLHTDMVGAAARGWATALITRDGLFAGHDATDFSRRAGIHLDWEIPHI